MRCLVPAWGWHVLAFQHRVPVILCESQPALSGVNADFGQQGSFGATSRVLSRKRNRH